LVKQLFIIDFKERNKPVSSDELKEFIDTHYFGEVEIEQSQLDENECSSAPISVNEGDDLPSVPTFTRDDDGRPISSEWQNCEICGERKAQLIHEGKEICVLCKQEAT